MHCTYYCYWPAYT